jgi:hypothetical protein
MKPREVLGRIVAHEMTMNITKCPSPSNEDVGTSNKNEKEKEDDKKECCSSSKKAQEQESSSSSSEESSSSSSSSSDDEMEDEDDDQSSCSSDDEEETKQLVRRVTKMLKKLNSKGVPIKQMMRHHQEKIKKKTTCLGCGEKGHYIEYCPKMKARRKRMKKERKERKRASKEALTSIGPSYGFGGFDASSSSDEETHRKPRSFLPSSSSSHICLMAKGMSDSDVSDDDSSPSFEELVEHVRSQEVAIKKLVSKNKELKEKLASSSSNYQELVEKFDMVIDHNDELSKKLELLESTKTTSKSASKVFEEKPKMDASTSCIDLIDESCSPSCNESVILETIDDLIAQENEELKQEVERLSKDLKKLKGKEKASECKGQPSQDNRPKMVKKLEKGSTATCYSCHQKGHKSYECKNKKKGEEKKNKNLSNTKPYLKVDKKKSTPYLLKKKDNKVVAHLINKQGKGWNQPIWVPKEIITTMKGSKKVWVPKET